MSLALGWCRWNQKTVDETSQGPKLHLLQLLLLASGFLIRFLLVATLLDERGEVGQLRVLIFFEEQVLMGLSLLGRETGNSTSGAVLQDVGLAAAWVQPEPSFLLSRYRHDGTARVAGCGLDLSGIGSDSMGSEAC